MWRRDNQYQGVVPPSMALAGLLAMLSLSLSGTSHAQLDQRQLQLLTTKCVQCHAVPHTGAPQMGRPDDWQAVRARGEEQTLVHVVEGIGGMPPLGYCSACSEGDLRALLRFVAGFDQVQGEASQ